MEPTVWVEGGPALHRSAGGAADVLRYEQEAYGNRIDVPAFLLEELHTGDLDDPEYQAEWERTRLAHEVAQRVIVYRVEHDLTQTELACMLGMRQPHIARLEAAEHEPSLATLSRLARVLDMEFHIDITRSELRLSA